MSALDGFFIAQNKVVADELMDPDLLMAVRPDYYGPRFDALKELRDEDDGTLHKGNEFRRVASLVNVPLANAISTVLDPEWMKDKNKFYGWLDRNREYCTYQRKDRITANQIVQRDFGNIGKEVPSGGLLGATQSDQPQEG